MKGVFGVGTDIVAIGRMHASLERHGMRFANRILAAQEIGEFEGCARPADFLAKRFAVKEAVVKAFGTGFRNGISLRDIALNHTADGKPELAYSSAALEFVRDQGIRGSHISIADERDYAVAFVILTY